MNQEVTVSTYSIAIMRRDPTAQGPPFAPILSYLYEHTKVEDATVGEKTIGLILRTDVTVPYAADAMPEGAVEAAAKESVRLARYQCDRLVSGAIAAHAIGTKLSAMDALIEAL